MKNSSPLISSPFAQALQSAIHSAIRSMRTDGITGASLECVMQAVRSPSPHLEGAPLGTNAAFFYRELFATACKAPGIRSFIIS